jgi:hypothetical protein
MPVCKDQRQCLGFQTWCKGYLTEGETRQQYLTRLFRSIVGALTRQYGLSLSGPESVLLELFVSHVYRLSTGRRSPCSSVHADMTAWEYTEYQAWWFHHLDDYWHGEVAPTLPPFLADICTDIEWFFLLKMHPSFEQAE